MVFYKNFSYGTAKAAGYLVLLGGKKGACFFCFLTDNFLINGLYGMNIYYSRCNTIFGQLIGGKQG